MKETTNGIPPYWKKATQALARNDKVMANLIRRYKGEALVGRGDAYLTLARSIVGQQISVKAADSIWQRVERHLGSINPASVLGCDESGLKACGLSRRKVEYMRHIAAHFAEHWPKRDWQFADDEEIIRDLSALRGIGRWTAEMFLIFYVMRPDVLPLDDIGLQKAVEKFYNGGKKLSLKEIAAIAETWRPWRSVATWYLWRGLDPVPVTY